MRALAAYLLGVKEFRLSWTTHTDVPESYGQGRELAHVLTFRLHEEGGE